MGEATKIQWTDHTFNPWWGCHKISPGCDNCYAESLSKRTGHDIWGPQANTTRRIMKDNYWLGPEKWNRAAAKAGRRDRVFCASMADVFESHPEVVDARKKLWGVIQRTPSLDWQILTKRPENIKYMIPDPLMVPRDNIWLGVSVENQEQADRRIPILAEQYCEVRFLSVEPLIDRVELDLTNIDWVIVGGESGPGARPMGVSWAVSIKHACEKAGVAFFFKQAGSFAARINKMKDSKGGDIESLGSEWLDCRRFPKDEGVLF